MTFASLWLYLAKFFLEWEMFQIKIVAKIKAHILYSLTIFPKIVQFMKKRRKI
jgi:hypothetical protein